MTFAIDSMSILLSWHAPDADEYSNGVLRQYYIEMTDNSSSERSFHIADATHLLFDNLQPGHVYTFRVASYASEKGPFSEPTSITLPSLQGYLLVIIILLGQKLYFVITMTMLLALFKVAIILCHVVIL